MDLAQTFNHAGCILFEKKQYEEACDAFCGALQSLVHSCHGKVRCQLDDNSRAMLVMDPAIQRAYDRIAMTGLFHNPKVASEQYAYRDKQRESSTGLPSSSQSEAKDETIEASCTMKPIMMPTSIEIALPESSLSASLQSFVTAMAIVWTNQGLVLQTQRNLHRSLACYAMARSWMCHTATTTVAVATTASNATDHGSSSVGHDGLDEGSLAMPHFVRKTLSNTIVYNTDKILLELGSIH